VKCGSVVTGFFAEEFGMMGGNCSKAAIAFGKEIADNLEGK